MSPVHYSSAKDNWGTPRWLFDALNERYTFDVDVCATAENTLTPPRYFTDALSVERWADHGKSFYMNPPYGRGIGRFIAAAHRQASLGASTVCLLPARTDTAWFHDYCVRGQVQLLKGRLKFGEAAHAAPFPSMLVRFAPGVAPGISAGGLLLGAL